MSELYYSILRSMKEVAEDIHNEDALSFVNKLLQENLDEDVKETPNSNVNQGISGLLNNLIISEYDAIDQYNSAIATAQSLGVTDIIPVLEDIVTEEHTHVGQLQAAVKLFDTAANAVQKGAEEAEDQLDTN